MQFCPYTLTNDSAVFDKVNVYYEIAAFGQLQHVVIDAKLKGIAYIEKPVIIRETVEVPDTRTHIYAGAWGWTTGRTAAGLELSFPSRWGVGLQADITGKAYAVGLTYRLR
jgi:hypothetical protein